VALGPSLSRVNPKFLYWVFIPFDIISLALQAGGGASSSSSGSANGIGVKISLVGLILQVITLVAFLVLAIDFLVRFYRSAFAANADMRLSLFVSFLGLSVLLILVRCVYRIYELKEGYAGEAFHDEPLFIALESV